ncbi:MAG: PKD domain-containing protein [Bacteroidales bacterium]|nr:PKD domain-containing protein [Bacteroidales bacterium]MCF8402483.1 PKD domain-containing protein [Bacteroidales bacterium]
MKMKVIYRLFCLIAFTHLVNLSISQDIELSVEGFVLDINNSTPVSGHLVEIYMESGGTIYSYESITDPTGFYIVDSIIAPAPGIISATTYDCVGQPHTQQAYFSPNITSFWFDFYICTDSSFQCVSYFEHDQIPFSFYDVVFFNLSQGNPDFYEWDFGDGSGSNAMDPIHTYVNPGDYNVCLTIWSIDSVCYDIFCETISVFADTLDCDNWFWYETPDFVDYTFFGESFPNPATEYIWDFGDGSTGFGQVSQHFYDPMLNDFLTVELTTIISEPAGDSCIAVSSQEIWVGNTGPDCYNWFDYISNDNFTFEFHGFSFPENASYFWDFGDGQTATGQDVLHTYSSTISDYIPVILVTYHYDPMSGDSCTAESQQFIPVGLPEPCTADFSFEPDSSNFLNYYFVDASSGIISNYFWDFGDGNFSDETDPQHLFPGPGNYQVCLTIFNDSLGIFCTDMQCYDLSIEYSISSQFSWSLDTLSGNNNLYFFQNLSTGDPTTFLWDFGDGNYSSSENPQHQYENSGEYEVCLQISRTFQNFSFYSDESCYTLITPNYFYLGGQVFLDGNPMNNINGDTTVVDTGMAFLYRKYENQIIPVDTNIFFEFGYYWFADVREGNYIVKTALTPNSENFNSYVSTYHQNALNWTTAGLINLSEANNFEANINLKPVFPIGQGTGEISGSIVTYGSKLKSLATETDVLVLLMDENSQVLSFVYTDPAGAFTFSELPLDTYLLYAEATGLYTLPVYATLDSQYPSATVELSLYENAVGISQNNSQSFLVGDVYPNPVYAKAFININSEHNSEVNIKITDLMARTLVDKNIAIHKGSNKAELNTLDLPSGVYLIVVKELASNQMKLRKFIK